MEKWERLLNELRAEFLMREQELELLHGIDKKLLEEVKAEELFDYIVQRTQELLGADHTTILLRRSTLLEPMYSNQKSIIGQRVQIQESQTGRSLQEKKTIRIADVTAHPHCLRYTPLRGYEGEPMRSLLATPLISGKNVIGVLNAESRKVAAFKPVHEQIARAVAAQISIALQRTQLVDSKVILTDVDRMMFASDHSQEVIQVALERVMSELQRLEHVKHTGAQIMFLRGDKDLEIMHSTSPSDTGVMVGVDTSISGLAVKKRETINVGDVEHPDYKELYKRLLGDNIRSEIAVPIVFGEDDIVLGVLNVESEEEDAFYGFYQIVLESFAEKVRTILAFARLRADVTEALELRSADDVLVAVGDQTSHLIHQLNNTVGAMRLRIIELQDILEAGDALDEDFLASSLDALRSLAERTLKMPNDITRLLGQGGSRVDVNEDVRHGLERVQRPANVELELCLGEGIPPLQLQCFDIVVQNLLQNGYDAMPQGGRLYVTTSSVVPQGSTAGYCQLRVRDTGVGMPLDVQRKMFDLNFTTKRERGRGLGLGLGLWWVRNFVRRSGGDIAIHSVVGQGTEVSVKIPLERPAQITIMDR